MRADFDAGASQSAGIAVDDGVMMRAGVAMEKGSSRRNAAPQHRHELDRLPARPQLGLESEVADEHRMDIAHEGDFFLLVEHERIARAPEERAEAELVGKPGVLLLAGDREAGEVRGELHGADARDVAARCAGADMAALQHHDALAAALVKLP